MANLPVYKWQIWKFGSNQIPALFYSRLSCCISLHHGLTWQPYQVKLSTWTQKEDNTGFSPESQPCYMSASLRLILCDVCDLAAFSYPCLHPIVNSMWSEWAFQTIMDYHYLCATTDWSWFGAVLHNWHIYSM